MAVLTVRMTDKEKADLDRRAKAAGVSTGGYVRQMLEDRVFCTTDDLIQEMENLMGDRRLRNRGAK